MAFKFEQRPTSGASTANPPTTTLEYLASGAEDGYFVKAYALSATATSVITPQGTLWRQDLQMSHEGFGLYYITVPYAREKKETGSYRFSFDTTGGSVHITASKETVGKFPASPTPPDFKQLIGVHEDQVDGVDRVIPALKMSYSFKHPLGVMSEAKARYLSSITGMVNSTLWHGFQAGEILFLGATGSDGTDAEAEVTYQVVGSANVDDLSFGDIANIVKKGHDYAWIAWKDAVDPGPPKRPVKQPEFVYVERLYDTVDLNLALGF